MQTVVMPASSTHLAWLEHYPPNSSAPVQTPLEPLPFVIGRNEGASLPLDSTRVSREHAVLTCEQGKWQIKDNGSTNGTFVNGKRVPSAELNAGDVICLADIEIVFHLQNPPDSSATMPMNQGALDTSASGDELAWDLIRDSRRLHEALTRRAVRNWFAPVQRLEDRSTFGYEALGDSERGDIIRPNDKTRHKLLSLECRLTSRLRRLHRLLAIEQAAQLPEGSVVFVKLASAEVGAPGVVESLARLDASLPGERRLGVELPYNAVCDIAHFRSFLQGLRSLDSLIVYDEFSGGRAQLNELKGMAPNAVKLARAVVRGVEHSSDRQHQISSVVSAAKELGCQVMAAGVASEAEAQTCAELGCDYGQGDHFGRPRSIRSLSH